MFDSEFIPDFSPWLTARRGGGGGASADTTLYMVVVLGQSNANAAAQAGPPLTTTTPAVSPTLKMFNGGLRPGTTGANLLSLTDLIDDGVPFGTSESICGGLGTALAALLPGKEFLFTISANDGSAYSVMAQGTATYNQTLQQVTAAKVIADAAGRQLRVLCMPLVHGEADSAIANTSYHANLATWQADYEGDIQAVTGQAEGIPFYVCQQTGEGIPQNAGASQPQVWTAHKADPANVVLWEQRGTYYGQQTDGNAIHVDSWSQRWRGQKLANFIHRRQFLSEDTRPVGPIPGQVNFSSGLGGSPTNTVTVKFTAPTLPLRWGFELVPGSREGNQSFGFTYTDDTSPPTVTAAALTASDTVTLTLSGVPTGTLASRKVRLGWRVTGRPLSSDQRISLCDSEPGVDAYGGMPMWNFGVVFEEAVT